MKNFALPLLALAIIGLGTSCSKSKDNTTTTTVTPTSPKVDYELRSSNPSAALKTTASGTITWTSGFATPTLIKFEAKQGTSEIEYKSTNTAQVDLFATTPVYFGNFTLPSGTYNEIELKISLDKSGANPALQLNGQFVSGGVTIPVTFTVNEPVELKTEQDSITVQDNNSFTSVTTFDLSTFTTGVTTAMLSGATLTGGTLVISSTSNAAIYSIIAGNLQSKHHHFEIEHHK